MKNTKIHIGWLIAELCEERLGSEYIIKFSKEYPLQWEIFTADYTVRVGGFAWDQEWFRLESPCKPNSFGGEWRLVVPKEYRDRVRQIVGDAIREIVKGEKVA